MTNQGAYIYPSGLVKLLIWLPFISLSLLQTLAIYLSEPSNFWLKLIASGFFIYAIGIWLGILSIWLIILSASSIATRRYPPKNVPVLFKTKVEHDIDAVIWGVLLIPIALLLLVMSATMFGITLEWFLPYS